MNYQLISRDTDAEIWFPYQSQSEYPRIRLFCFSHAGGNATLFRSWLGLTSPDIDICPVQIPGRGTRATEAPYRRISALIDAFDAAVQSRLDVPFAFFGHSMGSWIAYEAARRVRSRCDGRSAAHLFVSASRPPPVHFPNPRYNKQTDAQLIDLLRRFGGTSTDLLHDDEVMAAVLPLFRADLELLDTFHAGSNAVLDCPITVCGGQEDPLCGPDVLTGWSTLSSVASETWIFPGGHFYLEAIREQMMEQIAAQLNNIHS